MTSKTLAKNIADGALSKKAHDVAIMDLKKLTTMTDYFVVCSVDSDTQARAVADAIKHTTMEKGEVPVRKEGYSDGKWVLLDYVDVVVHVFHKDVRPFYNLEKLWGDAKFEYVTDEPPKAEHKKKPKKTAAKPVRKKIAKK
ncbi:MAG: ribosome silencing factor [Bacteroidota bacterium]|nr:ribosome silencing factor [Bacteroidota bacterium]